MHSLISLIVPSLIRCVLIILHNFDAQFSSGSGYWCKILLSTTTSKQQHCISKLATMSKKKEKAAGLTPEETVVRLETRLKEFEERTAKKIKDLEDLVQYLTNKVY